jgi:hypothetical protein
LSDRKKRIFAKVKKLNLPVSELMQRGAFRYESGENNDDLGALADAAKRAADRASGFIDDALAFIAASNKRIAAMESNAAAQPARKAR